ncbi:UNVERIFIED_CONTAM: Protochlorophyllide-dependent translocon component 52, chloroplastic [Sesamum radiatum]|uniref:Protochlorophyllide-dependent translocon component 52, chloroplastic n=1 Tax=Sesamum radiatum TaxID=300843 RepID=A0AAW2ULC9_SESRA
MEALKASSFPSFRHPLIPTRNPRTVFDRPILHIPSIQEISTPHIIHSKKANFKIFTAISPTVPSTEEPLSPDQEVESEKMEEKFDWYAHWYPVVPLCDLDKRRPHAKKVMGIDIVIWWDRNESEWKVFDDSCPHRLAPLSEGRIDQWGRLQCVYHGWCFGGSGDCKFIPQAPRDGPRSPEFQSIHTSKKACVAVYPSCVQNGILWFWPNTDPQYKNIYSEKKPHYIPELDDPSYTNTMICRDIPYGRWLNKYGGTRVDWGTKFSGLLPPTPPREQLFDRYWTHTMNCSSCSLAHKSLNVLEMALQIISISCIGIVAAAKQGMVSVAARYGLVSVAIICFLASKWLSHFIYKTFRYHDYDHAFR